MLNSLFKHASKVSSCNNLGWVLQSEFLEWTIKLELVSKWSEVKEQAKNNHKRPYKAVLSTYALKATYFLWSYYLPLMPSKQLMMIKWSMISGVRCLKQCDVWSWDDQCRLAMLVMLVMPGFYSQCYDHYYQQTLHIMTRTHHDWSSLNILNFRSSSDQCRRNAAETFSFISYQTIFQKL